MTLGRQLGLLIGLLILSQVVVALGAIGLIERMSPVMGHVLASNERTVLAVERMLIELSHPIPIPEVNRVRFFEAVRAAEDAITEPEERSVIYAIRRQSGAALAGDPGARLQLTDSLSRLSAINRAAISRTDDDARRLSLAGRWAVAFLALIGIGIGVVAQRRVRFSVVEPVMELASVLAAHKRGDHYRRCRRMTTGELEPVLSELNRVLDAADQRVRARERDVGHTHVELVFAEILDRSDVPLVLVDAQDRLVAAGRRALDVLAQVEGSLADGLRNQRPWVIDTQPLADSPYRIVQLGAR